MDTGPYEDHGSAAPGGDPTAAPAAAGLFLLAAGGLLLNTTRPWHKPGHPALLGLTWTVALAMLLWGATLLTRSIRATHGPTAPPQDPAALDEPPRPGDFPTRPA
ncbi:hypothetical protein ABZ924_23115 [Streptomyces sp. NPDC046876]|uniref:hypothetical protein n=1 Tax=Streptomyces sp. NPDC046876 TaxID=3155616 RepID=UPI0033FBFD69